MRFLRVRLFVLVSYTLPEEYLSRIFLHIGYSFADLVALYYCSLLPAEAGSFETAAYCWYTRHHLLRVSPALSSQQSVSQQSVSISFVALPCYTVPRSHVCLFSVSISRSPSCLLLYMCCTDLCTIRVGCILRMCPSHLTLTALITAITSYVLVSLLASSCTVLPVTCDSIWLLHPLGSFCTCACAVKYRICRICHASDP